MIFWFYYIGHIIFFCCTINLSCFYSIFSKLVIIFTQILFFLNAFFFDFVFLIGTIFMPFHILVPFSLFTFLIFLLIILYDSVILLLFLLDLWNGSTVSVNSFYNYFSSDFLHFLLILYIDAWSIYLAFLFIGISFLVILILFFII